MRDSGEGIRCIHQVYITCGRFASMQLFSQRSHVDILRETHKLLAAHGHSLHFIEFNSNAAFTRVFDTFLLGCGSSLLANSSALMALISRSLVKFQRAPAGCFVPPFALPFLHHMWSFLWLPCFHCSVNTVKSFPYLLQLVCVCTCPHLVVQLQLSPFQSMGHRWRRCSSDTNRLCSIYGLTTASLDMKSEHHLNKCVKPILQSSP